MLTAPRLDAAQGAAAVQFVSGTVTLNKADGGDARLKRGDELSEGDSVVTGDDGRVQLHFSDGGQVSLIPDSEFQIEAFRQSEKPEAGDRLIMRLVKGGLRTISGRIGKVDRAAYQMKTTVATIGIRGTEYTLLYRPQGGLTGSVAEGRIATCNAGGCLDVGTGQSFLAIDPNTQPVLMDKAADLGAPPPSRKRVHQALRGREKPAHSKQLARDSRPDRNGKLAERKTGKPAQPPKVDTLSVSASPERGKTEHARIDFSDAKESTKYDRSIDSGYAVPTRDKGGKQKESIVLFRIDDVLPAGMEDSVRGRVSSVLEDGTGAVKVKSDGKQKAARN